MIFDEESAFAEMHPQNSISNTEFGIKSRTIDSLANNALVFLLG